MRVLSIRRPYAEQILRGTKRIEYRGRATSIISKRSYIYASLNPGKPKEFEAMGLQPGDLPAEMLVGTAGIKSCTGRRGDYEWHLKSPRRLKRKVRPTKHPQPVWFNSF